MARYLDVIEWRPTDPNALVGRVPESGPADIRMGAQLIVRQSQSAIFYRDGQAMDVFGPGRHTLSTANIPVLTEFISRFTSGGSNVFAAEVYFVNQQVLTDLKWGTPNPIDLKDPDLGWVQLRAFGTMSVRVEDPQLFVNTLVGTRPEYTAKDLNATLKGAIRTRLNDLLSTTFQSYARIRSNLDELVAAMKVKVKDDFGKYGVSLRDFFIQDVSVPEEIQAAFRQRATMGALGVNNYMEYKAANAMGDMANNQGMGGAGMSMGMGMMMPQMMQQAFASGMQQHPQQQAPQAAPPVQQGQPCSNCHQMVPAGTKFCPNCGTKVMPAGTVACPNCGSAVPQGSKFCPDCGTKIAPEEKVCQCGAKLPPGTKFCPSCGTKQ
ncbi:MAG: SPFH domain-containing protein [bacterium]|nr:SPFH domain-containing protein [bacterium]